MSAPETVSGDLACGSCGYNLRTLAVAGLCPECGSPVAVSLAPAALPPIPAPWRLIYVGGVAALVGAGFLMAIGTLTSRTPWPGTAWLGLGVTGPRLWLPAASRQIVGLHDPRETVPTVLTFAGVAMYFAGAAVFAVGDPNDRRHAPTRVARGVLRTLLLVYAAFTILLCLDGPRSPKYWGRGNGLMMLALLDLAAGFWACRIVARIARRARLLTVPRFLWWTWGGFVLTYPIGMLIVPEVIVGLMSVGTMILLGVGLCWRGRVTPRRIPGTHRFSHDSAPERGA